MALVPASIGAGRSRAARAVGRPLRILAWPYHLESGLLEEFSAATSVPVEVTEVNSNEAFVNSLSAGGSDERFDVVSPSSVRALDWAATDLLQPWDMQSIQGVSHVNPRMLEFANREWRLQGKGPYWLPYTWGAEAIGWRTDEHSLNGRAPSFGDVWHPPGSGDDMVNLPRVMISPHSGLVGAGLYLESIGELAAGATWETYQTETRMREVFDQVTAWCIERQRKLRLRFWRDASSQREGFVSDLVSIGQTWDGPTLELRQQGLPIKFQAPREGALVWQNGFSLVAGTPMAGAAHALMSFLCQPTVAGRSIDSHGFNSAVLGAERYASARYRNQFLSSFPGAAVRQLNLWPPEQPWYLDQRIEYRNRLVAAAPVA